MIEHRTLRLFAAPATLAIAILALVVPTPVGMDNVPSILLLSLLAAALFVEGLPLDFPDRAAVTLSVLPAALLWHYFGPYVAATGIGASIAAMRLLRRQPAPAVSAACAIIAVWSAHLLTRAITPHLPIHTFDPRIGVGIFCLVYATVSPALSALVGDANPRPEPISSLVMLPLVIVLIDLAQWRGTQMLPIFLLGSGAILLLVRSSVNMMTLNRRAATLSRQAEESAAAFEVERDILAAVVKYSGDGIFTVDRDLRIRHFNPALTALTGLREEMVVGRPIEEVLGPQHAPAIVGDALRRAMREGRAMRIDSELETPDGRREFTTGYTAVTGPGGGFVHGVGGVHDVTEEKEQARIRDDFFSLVTHDLRSPLTTMMGNTYLLEQELSRSLDESATARRLVGRVEEANERLLRLVNNLLELQRIDSGRDLMHPLPVFLRPLIEDLVEEFRDAALKRAQTICFTGPSLRAWGDQTWCREILANLLSNAIKYTPEGGTIDLSIEARGGQVAISVGDTGHGLLPDEQEQLFTRFFRSKRPEIRSSRGTGLGLALSKRMAERMGGDIVVRSAVGVGSTFTVLLPLGDVPPFVENNDHVKEATEPALS